MYDSDKRKLLSLLSHGSIFFGALWVFIGVPLAVLFVSDDPVVKENAKEALNFHINIWLYEAIITVLWLSIIGIPLALILLIPFFLFHWVLPIFAILHILGNAQEPYRYPFIFRLV
ncbi:DUF4870 domain-containing protein [Argonema galeatum]|uniref:DUF4870 domain-containing protein n=1 Tax=Argonema galeatum TaxID=2942762 RepID=UPI0020120D6B|nr:DUF4870 domain-containing protein [Argonema galeatum]MCL1463705.1 DUF4870 domain-containing protein [Argonema galeatum A003/A1]